MYLIFDTETTGLPLHNDPPEHPNQARVCQLGLIVLDENFVEQTSFCSLVKPSGDNWKMNPGAQAAHGITTEDCIKYGIGIETVLEVFDALYSQTKVRVAHNLKFDGKLLDIEAGLAMWPVDFSWGCPNFNVCTMLSTTNICKLPGKNGNFKWPKLIEAHQHFFNEPFDNAHDALADVRATARIFKHLKQNKLIP